MKYDFQTMRFCSHGVERVRGVLAGSQPSELLRASFAWNGTPEGHDFLEAQCDDLTPEGRAKLEAILAQADEHGGMIDCAPGGEGGAIEELLESLFGETRYDAVVVARPDGDPLTPKDIKMVTDACDERGQAYEVGAGIVRLKSLTREDAEGFTQWLNEQFAETSAES